MTSNAVGFTRDELTLAQSIPATLLRVPSPRGLVIFSNGFSAPRQQAVPPGVRENPISPPLVTGLLSAGYDVLAPENPAHGERLDNGETTVDALGASFSGRGVDVLGLMQDETSAIVDDVIARGLGAPGRIAALGHSWGGLATMLRIAGDRRITVGIALIPVVDPRCLDSMKPYAEGPVLSRFDLAARLGRELGDRPLLVITGDADDVTPSPLTRRFLARMRDDAHPARLEHVELTGVAHEYDPAQLSLSLSWLENHLEATRA